MILIPIITLLIIFFYYQKKNKNRFGIISLLILTYLGMGAACIVIELSGLFPGVFPFALEPMAYLSVCFVIVFSGFAGYRDQKLSSIMIENAFLSRVFEYTLLVGGFLAIGFFLPHAARALSGSIDINRRDLYLQQEILGGFGIVNSIFSLISNMFIIAIVYSFMNMMPRNGKRNVIKAYLLLFSSFSYVIYIFAYVGRDGVVYWIMSFVFCFLLFKDFLSKNDLRQLKRVFIYSLPVIAIPFMMISISRFSESNEGVGYNVLYYAGQQIVTFNDHYSIDVPIQYGRGAFPVFIDVIEKVGFTVKATPEKLERFKYYLDYDVAPWRFSTFIGSLKSNFGKIGTLIFLFAMSLLTRKIIKKTSKTRIFKFSNLLLFILLYQVVYWGVFYFRMYSTNYYILAVILLFIMFKVGRSRKLSEVYLKNVKQLE